MIGSLDPSRFELSLGLTLVVVSIGVILARDIFLDPAGKENLSKTLGGTIGYLEFHFPFSLFLLLGSFLMVNAFF